jgi:predicted metal-dependent hydrolase
MDATFSANGPLAVAWCDDCLVTSSIMEAVSLATPVMERFVTRAVANCMGRVPRANSGVRMFIREEAEHSRVHRAFNKLLVSPHGRMPPALTPLIAIIRRASRSLPVPSQLMFAATVEHFSAVISMAYLNSEKNWKFTSDRARDMFARHAREELAHRSFVFDLWISKYSCGPVRKALAMTGILCGAIAYLLVAVPWIHWHKTEKGLVRTTIALARFSLKNFTRIHGYLQMRNLYSMVRKDFHPEHWATTLEAVDSPTASKAPTEIS